MPHESGPEGVRVRRADERDVRILAHHRVGMFRDMGEIAAPLEGQLAEASESFFRQTIASGEYVAWLAVAMGASQEIVAGAGLWLRPMIPRPRAAGIAQGREGLIVNVYTEPAWRRRGLAAHLMRHVLEFTREHHIARVLLHASNDGRPLYESLGFVPTNEMRLSHSG